MMSGTPLRNVRLGPSEVECIPIAEGGMILRSPHPLAPYPDRITERLTFWASHAPDRTFLSRRGPDGNWQALSYARTLERVRTIAQALLDRRLSPERPIAILSENSLEHALLALAALHVGIPYSPISSAYALISSDFGKLRHILGLLTPGLVFVDDGNKFGRALQSVVPPDTEIVVVQRPPEGRPATLLAELDATAPSSAVEAAHARVGPDTLAKILFTSGSTGMPKGVINTHRMLCSNQQMIAQSLPFLMDEPPVLVDWLPWNHTFGGNHNFNLVLYHGGTFYIDDGKPVPGAVEKTVRNLREIAPTLYFNVPKGYEELVTYFKKEPALQKTFFSRVKLLYYAGAGLSPHVWDSLEELAVESYGERILMTTGLGSTETAPFALVANWDGGQPGLVGLPAPGVEVKLLPNAGKLEARFRGPNITPGYWRQDELTRDAFDEEGFYRIGDALRFLDPQKPEKGLLFDGRIAEDFKLATGTWVSVGTLRAKVIAAGAPLVQDVVIAGHDRNEIAAIIFVHLDACRRLCTDLPHPDLAEVQEIVHHPDIREQIQRLLDGLGKQSTGSANRVVRAIVADEAPSIDANEITDKGSLNQRAVLKNRMALVERLYADPPDPAVIVGRSEERS